MNHPRAEDARHPRAGTGRGDRSGLRSALVWARVLPLFALFGSLFLAARLFFSRRRLDRFLKWGCRVLVRAAGIRVAVTGSERVDPARAYTVMLNHTSAIDHIVAYGHLPLEGRGIEAAENFHLPLYGRITRAAGNYPLSRGDLAGSRSALAACRHDALRDGFSIYCAPEGTRSRDGRLGPLKSGVFNLARDCGRDILPVVLLGLAEVLPPEEWRIRPGAVEVRVLPPVLLVENGRSLAVAELRDRVRSAFVGAGLEERRSP